MALLLGGHAALLDVRPASGHAERGLLEDGPFGDDVPHAERHPGEIRALSPRADLEGGIAAGEIALYYQPVIDLARGDMAGMEALARWRHPLRGTLAPDEFIPLAEETGLIAPLGRGILQAACEQAVAMQREHPREPPLTVSVNVSAFQLSRPELAGELAEVLAETGIESGTLVLELSEKALMRDPDLSIARMNELRSLGVRLAIDDFGSGYSSLTYLRRLPVDLLKIDRSFLADPGKQATLLTAAVVQVSRIFALQAVVKGIETERQLARLREERCDFGQGFYFARPLTPEELRAFARRPVPLDPRRGARRLARGRTPA